MVALFLFLFLKAMMGALAPFCFLVINIFSKNLRFFYKINYTIMILGLIIKIHFYETFSTPSPK
jgi:hypothetical protein